MDHITAISAWLVPILLGVIAYQLQRFMARNERDHDEFFQRTNEHSIRLTRVETEVDHLRSEERR